MNPEGIQIWSLLAGLGLFRFGMLMLEDSLKILAGRSFKKFLRNQTGNSIKAVIAGATVTAILQSSTMVSLLVMSFAGAGILGLKNGIGMILGANLGTTMTGWLVSLIGFKLNIGTSILPFIAIGGLGIMFSKSEKFTNISKMIMGFSLMFLGLNYMKEGFEMYALHFDFTFLLDKSPILFLMAGLVLAASIQSSSASMIIFLSSLAAGVINFNQAIFLVIGADLGTTFTAVISTINANSIKKKVGWSQFFFNVFTASVALLLIPVYLSIITDFANIRDPLIKLVAFHSTMNLAGIILILPFLKYFTAFIDKIIKNNEISLAKNISMVNPVESNAALEALQLESIEFFGRAIVVLENFFHLPHAKQNSNAVQTYSVLKNYENEIVNFYIKVQQNKLHESEVSKINALIAVIRSATLSVKAIKDIKHNLDDLYNSSHDDTHGLYKSTRQNQQLFYNDINEILQNLTTYQIEDLVRLKEFNHSIYHSQTEEVYKLFSETRRKEIVIPDLLNFIREVYISNGEVLKSLNTILASVEKFNK